MKPLVLFSSLAVLCAGGLMALSYQGWQDEPSALTSLAPGSQTVKIKPGEAVSTPPAVQQPAEATPAVAEKPEEKVAAVAPEQAEVAPSVEPAPTVETAPTAKLGDVPAEPEAETETATFDIVRVEEDGTSVLAGRAEPGSTVRLLIDEQVAAETQANERGEWVVIPDNSMSAGAHQIQIETENKAGEVKRAEQSVALTVPDTPGTQPLIVLSETAKPSIVLQKPQTQETKQVDAAQETQAATEDAPANEASGQTTDTNQMASAEPAVEPAPETKTAALQPPAADETPTIRSTPRKLTVDVVDYDEAGLTTFSGRSTPDNRVRVYVDNRFAGETTAGRDGGWAFTAGREITPGPHALRTDEIGPNGKVVERIELPFFRESAERIASLQAQRKATAETGAEKPDATATAATDADATEKMAMAETRAEPAETKTSDTSPDAVETKPVVSETEGEQVQAAVTPQATATQQPSEGEADTETMQTEVAPVAVEPGASQQQASTDEAPVDAAKPEPAEQTAVVEAPVEAAESEPAEETAVVEAPVEPAKPEASEQTAMVEAPVEAAESEPAEETAVVEAPVEPAKPEASDQTAMVEAPVEAAESEPAEQTAVVEAAVEPARPEASEQTAVVEAPVEPAKPEASDQTAMVEAPVEAAESEPAEQTATAEDAVEPAKPDSAQQQAAVVEPVAEPDDSAQLKATVEENALTEEIAKPAGEPAPVETAAISSETEQAVTGPPAAGKVVIQPGNNLWNISRVIYGKGIQYTVIYEANKDQIRNPDKIYPGQIFETPGSNAPESIDPACRGPLTECN